jgi:crossover junction endodeoxyribonuclease RusA
MTHIILPYPPSANRLWRNARGRMIPSAEAVAFKGLAGIQAARARMPLRDGPVQVCVILHPKKPKRPGKGEVRSIDLDNALKAALDALQGIAYTNDRQIQRIVATRGEPVPSGALSVEVSAA